MTQLLHADVTNTAWRAYYNVYNAHGHNYPEAFYEEMMRLEFEALGMPCATQVEYFVAYKDVIVGKHITDTEIGGCVVLEYKVTPQLLPRHEAQLISNLKISGKQVGLLLNFGSLKPQGERRVYTRPSQPMAPWDPGPADPNLLYPELTLELRNGLHEVYGALGPGFVTRVYANATRVELRAREIPSLKLRRLEVIHRGHPIGEVGFHHFIVDDKLVLAPVAVSEISQSEQNKVRTIMTRRGLRLGMIVKSVQIRRAIGHGVWYTAVGA
jgi:GxxExxY protein